MNNHQLPTGPAVLVALDDAPLKPFDILGRQKCFSCGLNKASAESEIKKEARSSFAKSEPNAFKYKSLSCWSYNIAVGCTHGCLFCYVPDAQQTGPGKEKQNNGPLAKILREFGVVDPDAEWGKYLLLRPFDEEIFLASLEAAENTPPDKLNPDGNRAIIFCSSTDAYQTIVIPGDPVKQKVLNHLRRHLVRRALELIRDRSTLNVRILTRSPLAKEDFDLFKTFGPRLLFGMSLPTLRNDLARLYEPHAPAPTQRLATLQAAKEAGIPIFVAMAPTYPECDEADLRATLEAISPLNPVTIFHEPINMRAKNVERIAAHARELGVELKSEVFETTASWRLYAYSQLLEVEEIAGELGLSDCLHLWPDASFKSKAAYRDLWPSDEGQKWGAEDDTLLAEYYEWIARYHNRISEWPRSQNGAPLAASSTVVEKSAGATSQYAPVEIVDDSSLTVEDREFLDQRETIVADGQTKFLEVGKALMEIRDYKNGILIRSYGSLENYCRQRWGFGQSQAYRLIGAAEVLRALSPIGENRHIPLPVNENQTRPLMQLKLPQDQQRAWESIIEKTADGKITGTIINQAVKEQIANGAERTQRERKTGQAKAATSKLGGKSLDAIRDMLKRINKATMGNKVVAKLVRDIGKLLPV